jgi:hypothetical protein
VEKATAELLIGAFFLAMCSCEYCDVHRERKTKLLTINNFSFYKNNKLLSLNDNLIQEADFMKITFEFQKTDKKNQPVFHHQSGHLTLCPIKIWSSIIRRILNYCGSSPLSKVNLVQHPDGSLHHITNNFLITKLHLAAKEITFSMKWSCNGYVSCRHPCVYNPTDRALGK